MRKINAGLFISLDGVVESPEKWTGPYFNDQVGQAVGELMADNDALLLGRVTYEGFAAAFGGQSGGMADQMNSTPKFVVSGSLAAADWQNSTLISGNLTEAISALKQQPGKNIGMSGSSTLVSWLLRQGLLDQLDLLVFPVVLGTGKRLFDRARRPGAPHAHRFPRVRHRCRPPQLRTGRITTGRIRGPWPDSGPALRPPSGSGPLADPGDRAAVLQVGHPLPLPRVAARTRRRIGPRSRPSASGSAASRYSEISSGCSTMPARAVRSTRPQSNRYLMPPGRPGRGRRKSMHASRPWRTSIPHSSRTSRRQASHGVSPSASMTPPGIVQPDL